MASHTLPSSQVIDDKDKNNVSAVSVLEAVADRSPEKPKRGAYFWLSFLAICVSLFMSAIETSGTSTALPTIISDLQGDDFVWVGSAYPLAATALLPASGGMAQVFGRRATMLVALALFALGSALCGCAQSMSWLIAARTIQGAGGGALQALAGIIVSDLVSLEERGTYNSFIGLTWAVAAAIGPLVGGGLADRGQWRWFFYINLPITGLAAILVLFFLKLKTPAGTFKEKLLRMDWIGNIIFVGSATSTAIALTWGGLTHPWNSAATLVPLIIGICGLAFFLFYEEYYAAHPIVPFKLLSNRTSLSGYLQTFFTPVVMIAVAYYFATYWQSVKGASAIRSGVCFLAMTFVLGPTMIVTGASITITKTYRVQLWLAWVVLVIAMGVFTTVRVDTPGWHSIFFSGLVGLGCGMSYSAQYFPVLAPLPVSENAHALALFSFFRTFASVWAITIGGTVLQNQLVKRLPEAFTSQFPSGAALAYASIPAISKLPEPLRTEVRTAFAESIRVIWQVLTGIAGMGFLSSLAMKGLPLHTQVDERWGIEDGNSNGAGERSESSLRDREIVGEKRPATEHESILPQLD
ncbi:iron permease [Irpex rosettiformis]|uniref:Iron permease n=1 Tax=Irpex rosettiformis TaxID=378272 RepID=A0ACB8TMR3_9APHY|nr:iron permease [Irpex rosettiformis]